MVEFDKEGREVFLFFTMIYIKKLICSFEEMPFSNEIWPSFRLVEIISQFPIDF